MDRWVESGTVREVKGVGMRLREGVAGWRGEWSIGKEGDEDGGCVELYAGGMMLFPFVGLGDACWSSVTRCVDK